MHDLAWLVDDAAAAHARSSHGAAAACASRGPSRDEHGELELAQVAAFGDTVHTFVNRSRYRSDVLEPGYSADNLPNPTVGPPVGLQRIDHVVGNVEQGELDDWVAFYSDVLGFVRDAALRRRPDPHRALGADVDRRVGRADDR